VIPRDQWRFTSPTSIALDGGFQPSRWYEVIYRSSHSPVAGAGLLALRDVGAYLRAASGVASEENCAAVFASGISQTGRVLREFVFQGLNAGEGGEPVFDGVHADIASARRGEFNRRYAQPGLLSPMMPEYGPPYNSAALLARQRELGGVPKLLLTNSAWEYWRGDGALVHQDPVTGADLPEDPDVRTYLISGTDHLGPAGPIKRAMPLANPPHNLDRGPVLPCSRSSSSGPWTGSRHRRTPASCPTRRTSTSASSSGRFRWGSRGWRWCPPWTRRATRSRASGCPRWRPGWPPAPAGTRGGRPTAFPVCSTT
jgi:Alpha/beta hydrolase domain